METLTSLQNICVARESCRICGSPDLAPVLDIGKQFLASLFIKEDPPEYLNKRYPLELIRCQGRNACGLVQLRHSVSSKILYSDYGYQSGINESMRQNLSEIAKTAGSLAELKPGDTVLDIGCNDGTLLASYETPGIDKLGFDLAANVLALARQKGLEVLHEPFSAPAFFRVRPGRRAKIVTSIAMFYDLENPLQFAKDIVSVLAEDGLWVIELSYLPLMLQMNAFDTICHEHLEYYSLGQIEWMAAKTGLAVHEVELNDVNGGSFRIFLRKKQMGSPKPTALAALERIREEEKNLSLHTDAPYENFRARVVKIRSELLDLLRRLKREGKTVYIYGASTKGNTILQFFGIDKTLVSKAADRNPDKWGRRTLGTEIPIISEEQARRENPDYFLALPWHFFEGFKTREAAFLERGGKFIVPLPQVRVVGRNG